MRRIQKRNILMWEVRYTAINKFVVIWIAKCKQKKKTTVGVFHKFKSPVMKKNNVKIELFHVVLKRVFWGLNEPSSLLNGGATSFQRINLSSIDWTKAISHLSVYETGSKRTYTLKNICTWVLVSMLVYSFITRIKWQPLRLNFCVNHNVTY